MVSLLTSSLKPNRRSCLPRLAGLAVAWLVLAAHAHAENASSPAWFDWKQIAALPDDAGVEGALLARHKNVLFLLGGIPRTPAATSAQKPTPTDAVFALLPTDSGKDAWRKVGQLPCPLTQAAAVETEQGVLVLGGTTPAGPTDQVCLVRWNPSTSTAQIDATLPPLPSPCRQPGAAKLDDRVYIAGGDSANGESSDFWLLDLTPPALPRHWRQLPSWSGPPRHGAALIAQSNGERPCLYLLGGTYQGRRLTDAHRFDPRANAWQSLSDMPEAAPASLAASVGQSHIVLLDSPLLAYHTITDTWTTPGDTAVQPVAAAAVAAWPDGLALIGTDSPSGSSPPAVYVASLRRPRRLLGVLDFTVLVLYLLLLVAVGLYFSRRGASTEQFFLGGRRIPWWAAGLSLLAAQVSSIGFMAVPAKSFATDWAYFTGVATWFLVVPIVTAVYIPFFRRLNVTSAYEYLEARFNLPTRLFGSAAYSLLQLGRMAVVLYLPALALAAVTGLNQYMCIVVMGVLCTLYTAAGGIEAVVWTEVVQAVIMLGGALLCVSMVVFGIKGGVTRFVEIAAADGKFHLGQLDWNVTAASVWIVLVGNFFIRLSSLTSDQGTVQRYLTTRDERQSARALWTDVAASIPWALIVFLLGTALYVYYKLHPERLSPAVDTDGLVPFFVAQQLPAGVAGLVIAAVFAAAMSSMDSSMHSTATVLVTDFYARLVPTSSDHRRLLLARLLTVLLGAFGTATALVLASTNIYSLWDLFQSVVGMVTGGLAGLFVLGMFTRRAHGPGALTGAIASAALLYLARPHVHFFLYPVIGVLGCLVVGYLASCRLPGQPKTAGLTVFSLRPPAEKP